MLIKNLWKITVFYCGNHESPIKMDILQGPHSAFYRCPEYVLKYAKKKGCPNRISPEEAEGILCMLSERIQKEALDGKELNLTGILFTYKNIDCKVIYYAEDRIYLCVTNKRTVKINT